LDIAESDFVLCSIGIQVSYTEAKEPEDSSLRINTHSSGLLIYYVKEVDFVQTSAFVFHILLTKHNSEQVSTLASQFETEVELRIFSPHVTYIAGVAVPEAVLTK